MILFQPPTSGFIKFFHFFMTADLAYYMILINLLWIKRPAPTDLEVYLLIVRVHCPGDLNGVIRETLTVFKVSGRDSREVCVATLEEGEVGGREGRERRWGRGMRKGDRFVLVKQSDSN